jgi:regulator of sirC expression with transglutaminase-like and TPR domain
VDAIDQFADLVAGENWIAVEDGALLIAAHLDETVVVDEQRTRLDDLADRVREPTLDGLRRLLFDQVGLAGDRRTYHDPRNSLLPAVLDRGQGIPLSLAVVTMAVGRRVGVPLDGVAMPGHFLVRDRVDTTVFIDVFDGGRELDAAACVVLFHRLRGEVESFDPSWLEPVPPRPILARMLMNLRLAFGRERDRESLRRTLHLLTLMPQSGDEEARELAAVLTAQGRFDLAAEVYDQLDDLDRSLALRARLN